MSVAPEQTLVNKRELAMALNVAPMTVDRLVERPGFPIERRGSKGIAWQFDRGAVIEFLATERASAQAAMRARSDLVAQLAPSLCPEGDARDGAPTGSQRLAMAKARQAELKLAIDARTLLDRGEARANLTAALSKLGAFLDGLPSQLCRQFGLPEELGRQMRRCIESERRAFVEALKVDLAKL